MQPLANKRVSNSSAEADESGLRATSADERSYKSKPCPEQM